MSQIHSPKEKYKKWLKLCAIRLVMVSLFSFCHSPVHTSKCCKLVETNVHRAKPGNVQSQVSGLFRRCCPVRVCSRGPKSHVSFSTMGRIFWQNSDLRTFTKSSRSNLRTFNQVVPTRCRAKCTHGSPHLILKLR